MDATISQIANHSPFFCDRNFRDNAKVNDCF